MILSMVLLDNYQNFIQNDYLLLRGLQDIPGIEVVPISSLRLQASLMTIDWSSLILFLLLAVLINRLFCLSLNNNYSNLRLS